MSKDRNSLILIWILNLVGAGLGIFFAFKLPEWRLPWRQQFYVLGFCLFALGLALRLYAIIYLGRFFTTNVAIAADHRLIDSGPYRLIRHPSYTGCVLIVFGLGLCIGNIATLATILVFFFIALLRRIQIEEKVLHEAFGEQYQRYRMRTKRLIPFVY